MGKTEKEAQKAELEQLCAEWAALGPEDGGRKLNLQGQIFELVFLLFPGREEWITSVFLSDWNRFDPAKGSAYGFFADRSKKRMIDAKRTDSEYSKHIISDTVQTDDGEEVSLLDKLPDEQGGDPGERMRMDAEVCALIAAMLELPQRLQGRANNLTRHNYFRMFYTDGVVTSLRNCPVREILRKRQRDMLAAMKLEFLDYFMAEQCRTVDRIADSPLKAYGELVEGREMEETDLPLPGDVYVSYLDRVEHTKVGLSAVSQQKRAYQQEVTKWIS